MTDKIRNLFKNWFNEDLALTWKGGVGILLIILIIVVSLGYVAIYPQDKVEYSLDLPVPKEFGFATYYTVSSLNDNKGFSEDGKIHVEGKFTKTLFDQSSDRDIEKYFYVQKSYVKDGVTFVEEERHRLGSVEYTLEIDWETHSVEKNGAAIHFTNWYNNNFRSGDYD